MRNEGQILFTALLYFQRLLSCVSLQSQTDRLVEDPIHDVERLALQVQAVVYGKIVNAAAQDVVLGNNLLNIERFLETLQTMRWRAAFHERFRNRLARPRLKRED